MKTLERGHTETAKNLAWKAEPAGDLLRQWERRFITPVLTMCAQPRKFFLLPNDPEPPAVPLEPPRPRESAAEALAKVYIPQLVALRASRPQHPYGWFFGQGEKLVCDLLDGMSVKDVHERFVQQTGNPVEYQKFSRYLAKFRQVRGLLPAPRRGRFSRRH